MFTGISISLSPTDRVRLVEIAGDRNSPQKHVWRDQIVLLSADCVGTNKIMRVTGTSKTCIWRLQQRFVAAGVDQSLVDKTSSPGIPPLGDALTERVVALTLTEPHGETTHWTATATNTAVAAACLISVNSVHRIWRNHGLRPHRIRQFKLSNDPQLASKVGEARLIRTQGLRQHALGDVRDRSVQYGTETVCKRASESDCVRPELNQPRVAAALGPAWLPPAV